MFYFFYFLDNESVIMIYNNNQSSHISDNDSEGESENSHLCRRIRSLRFLYSSINHIITDTGKETNIRTYLFKDYNNYTNIMFLFMFIYFSKVIAYIIYLY